MTSFALLDLSTPDLLIILAIVLLLFGSSRLPQLSRSIGESAKELKKGLSSTAEIKSEINKEIEKTKKAAAPKKSKK